MRNRTIRGLMFALSVAAICYGCISVRPAGRGLSGMYDVRAYGATGNGRTLDTAAVNRAITAANRDGGGTVNFPAGVYLCHSIHLKSNVTLYIGAGATIMAAPPAPLGSREPTYDLPEPIPCTAYEDFGHNHWHNSLIWGENLENIGIIGPGLIDGSRGLVKQISNDRRHPRLGEGLYVAGMESTTTAATTTSTMPATTQSTSRPSRHRKHATTSTKPTTQSSSQPSSYPSTKPGTQPATGPSTGPTIKSSEWYGDGDGLGDGLGNKSIALKLCRNVILRDFSVRCGGHFAILATGVDNFTLDNLKLDTNRDGMDLDCCQNVRVSNCLVNSPGDDGICPKSSLALGYARPCENITITNCEVSAYDVGTVLNGTYHLHRNKDGAITGGTGRIKLGTESNGGFKNITISNCVFDYCHGIALESVDGALLEDVTIDNITMRHPVESPIFLRLGARLRGPKQATTVGTLQRINISNVVVYDADAWIGSIISGIPGYPIKDVSLSNIHIFARGGGKEEWATSRPAENVDKYPDPRMFGAMPAYGFFVRHVQGIRFNNITTRFGLPEKRPPFLLEDVQGVRFTDVDAQTPDGIAPITLHGVSGLSAAICSNLPDTTQLSVAEGKLGSGAVPTSAPADDSDEDDSTQP